MMSAADLKGLTEVRVVKSGRHRPTRELSCYSVLNRCLLRVSQFGLQDLQPHRLGNG